MMEITIWGSRGSVPVSGERFARHGGATTCVEIALEGASGETPSRVIIDCGTGLSELGRSWGGRSLSGLFLQTHMHWDHIQGFPFFVPAYLPKNTVRVYGPRSLAKPLDKVLRGQMDPEYFPVALGDMAATISIHDVREQELVIGPFTVTHAYMNHPSVTLGYRVTAGGKTVTYATDTEPFGGLLSATEGAAPDDARRKLDDRLLVLSRDADLCISDAQYTAAEYKSRVGWGHSAADDTVTLAAEARVKRLALFSHDPMQDDDSIDAKVAAGRAQADTLGGGLEVFAAREGQVVRL